MIPASSFQAVDTAEHMVECLCNRSQDSLSLVQLYEATNGKAWRTKWDLHTPMDQWYGVHLNKQGCVKCLDLDGEADCSTRSGRGNGLKGTLPDLNLPHLKYLLLASNQLTGPLPDFTALPSVRVLRLSCNRLTGAIPDFQHLPVLKSLELDYNQLSGPLPDFQHLPALEILYVLANQLTGTVPDFSQVPKLQYFIASRNQFEGPLPEFQAVLELKLLLLNENQLSGRLPDLIHLYNLKSINLSDNQLSGEIFDWEGLTDLEAIHLSKNQLSGTIPALQSLQRLKVLDLSDNQIEGEVPDFSNLQLLKTIALSNNHLSGGTVPKQIPALVAYDLRGNHLKISDLQPHTTVLEERLKYSPQRCEGTDSLFIVEASAELILRLPDHLQHEGNWYSWYKDGEILEEAMDTPDLRLTNFSEDQVGRYYCKISHPQLPELELITPAKIVQLGASSQMVMAWDFDEIKPVDWERKWNTLSSDDQAFQIPGSITPNGDGRNDVFEIKALEDQERFGSTELMIFSAAGQLVFHAKPYENNWDGRLQSTGQPLPDGIYFYALQTDNVKYPARSGSLTIFR